MPMSWRLFACITWCMHVAALDWRPSAQVLSMDWQLYTTPNLPLKYELTNHLTVL
jgi:hypothetical protein